MQKRLVAFWFLSIIWDTNIGKASITQIGHTVRSMCRSFYVTYSIIQSIDALKRDPI